jgi:glyoxylase-like metal-dependent hydrolase (beta-lactamase superfamily II)
MSINRRTFGLGTIGAGALIFSEAKPFQTAALAAEPSRSFLPATQRFTLGDMEITALSDGYLELGLELFPAADPAEAEALLTKAFVRKPVATSVNAFLVTKGDQRVLIDTGTATAMGPNLGHVPEALAAAGIAPETIGTVIITHLHPDHANGLVNAAGKAAFPAAEVVLSSPEFAFWNDDGVLSKSPDGMKPFFEMARKATAPYEGKVRQIEGEVEIVPGIAAVPAPGHTPGHLALRISSGEANLLIFTDIVHVSALQFSHPEWAIAFDVDQETAIATRKRMLDMVATDRLLVAGMHLPFPGVGHVVREGDAYRYVPMPWPALTARAL